MRYERERDAGGCDYRSSLFLPLEPPIITGSRWTPKQKRDEKKTSYPFLSCINNTMMSLLLRCCLRKANTIPFRWLPLILNILGKCVARHQLTPIVWHWSCLRYRNSLSNLLNCQMMIMMMMIFFFHQKRKFCFLFSFWWVAIGFFFSILTSHCSAILMIGKRNLSNGLSSTPRTQSLSTSCIFFVLSQLFEKKKMNKCFNYVSPSPKVSNHAGKDNKKKKAGSTVYDSIINGISYLVENSLKRPAKSFDIVFR